MLKHPKRVSRPLFKSLNLFSYEKSGKVRKNFPTQKFGGGDLGYKISTGHLWLAFTLLPNGDTFSAFNQKENI